MHDWQEQQMQSLLSAKTAPILFNSLSGVVKQLGFDFCAYDMRLPWPVAQPKVVSLNNYPSSWRQRYNQELYEKVDPTVHHGRHSSLPMIWSDQNIASNRSFWEDARSHGLHAGWAQSRHDAKGICGLLNLSRSDDHVSRKELREISHRLSWLVDVAHEGLSSLLIEKHMPEADTQLTTREIEVLRWTADGKTSSEVSEIMHISDRTVNFHISNTLKKLNATNKTAAAIKAAMLGIL
ncbi:transcriptional regulator RhlR [Collimonas arenae]|uniref:Transcriptional regulator RhlR n=1 Tax=Collimonas arenae TaxID=279058 RepID=A0A0A1FBD8_9BURK|nr:autoinducer binding domain-containing protein [Collimonas arenae]AIY41826.1 transcriptional regulator RhlR [Collimonas arenae]